MAKEEGMNEVVTTEGDKKMSNLLQQGNQGQGRKAFAQKFAGVAKAKPIPKTIKKKRNNFRLRKIIVPKAPLMVLNEIFGSVNYTYVDNPPDLTRPGMPPLHTAKCVIDGAVYTGSGPSKQIAKNICAEGAIHAHVIKKCAESRTMEQKDSMGVPLKPNQMEDEIPWAQLASLSMFKLFNDWQANGYDVPPELWKAPDVTGAGSGEEKTAAAIQDQKPKTIQPAKKMPENPTSRHPVQLLNEMRGTVVYNLISETGTPPNCVFTMGTTINEKLFSGEGRNKKVAKRNCAVAVLKEVYEIVYPETNTPMKVE